MPRFNITPVVLNLLIINVLVFLGLNIYTELLAPYFVLFKSDLIIPRPFVEFRPVQIVTAFFSHIQIWHIVMNMLALVSLGSSLERVMGPMRFLAAYLTIGVVSTALTAFLDPSPNPVLGASGALFGMMVLFAFYFPTARMGLMFIPGSFKIKSFVIGAAVISAVLIIIGLFANTALGMISHFGHLSGIVAGFLYLKAGDIRKMTKGKR